MAKVRFHIDDRRHQIMQSRVILKTLGAYLAGRYLFLRNWSLDDALRVLLGIREQRKLVPLVERCDVPVLSLADEITEKPRLAGKRERGCDESSVEARITSRGEA